MTDDQILEALVGVLRSVHGEPPSPKRAKAVPQPIAGATDPVGLAEGEQWRPVLGYEGLYAVTDHGRVWSYRKRPNGGWLRRPINSGGYLGVFFKVNGQSKMWLLHRVVAEAFYGPRPEGMEVRHLDGNKLNPRLDNLQFGTRSENMLDRVRHGTDPRARLTHCKRGHEFTPENTYVALKSPTSRRCRACHAIRSAEHVERRRAKAA